MMNSNKGKRPLRHLTAGDKIDAIQRIHDGESKASVARDIGVPESTLRGWCKNEEKLRCMSRQTGVDTKLSVEKLTEKMADDAAMAAASMFGGPSEKRQKLDTSLPLNFTTNGKIKYEDLGYKSRNSLSALDFSTTDKGLSSLNFNGLGQTDFSAYKTSADLSNMNGHSKGNKDNGMKSYGADMSKPSVPNKSDISMAAISPLTSLSHLSGMSGIAQGLSFTDIASNLNLIYNNQSAMTGLNNLNALTAGSSQHNGSALRTVRQKPMNNINPRSNMEKSQCLTVKNLAKLQQKSTPAGGDHLSNMGLDMSDKLKKPTAAALTRDTAPVDDAVMYWLRSQQAMLGLNNLYSSMPSAASPNRSSPLQHHQQQLQQQLQQLQHQSLLPTTTSTPPPIATTPQTPSTTPSGTSEDTKNSTWFWQWYRTFGNSLLNNDKQNAINNNKSSMYDNILYSQLTKESRSSPSPRNDAINNNNIKAEDLSTQASNHHGHRLTPDMSPPPSAMIPHVIHPVIPKQEPQQQQQQQLHSDQRRTPSASPSPPVPTNDKSEIKLEKPQSSVQSVLDNLLYNNNNITNSNSINNNVGSPNSESVDSDVSGPSEAVEHGEKFLKWLESCSDPSITAMQVMQFRTLLNSIKTSADRANNPSAASDERSRIRRRK